MLLPILRILSVFPIFFQSIRLSHVQERDLKTRPPISLRRASLIHSDINVVSRERGHADDDHVEQEAEPEHRGSFQKAPLTKRRSRLSV